MLCFITVPSAVSQYHSQSAIILLSGILANQKSYQTKTKVVFVVDITNTIDIKIDQYHSPI